MNRRHQPLDPEERALARLLADAGDDGPPPEVDARILAAARAAQADRAQPATRAGATQPGLRRPQRRRWPLALGLAASVTLAVGVAWQLRLPPQPMPAATRGDTAVAPAAGTAHVVPETTAAAPVPQPDAAPRPAAPAAACFALLEGPGKPGGEARIRAAFQQVGDYIRMGGKQQPRLTSIWEKHQVKEIINKHYSHKKIPSLLERG